MTLLPVKQTLEENIDFVNNPLSNESLGMCIEFYKKVGFDPPWICYYAEENGELVGNAAFKGKPTNNAVEIAYGSVARPTAPNCECIRRSAGRPDRGFPNSV